MAHLTNTPYLNSSNIIPLLNDFAISLKNIHRFSDVIVDVLVVGGSALALKHELRGTVDIDADVRFSYNISDSINIVAKYHNIPKDWLNQDFTKSDSYSIRLWQNAILYATLQGYMRIFVVSDLDQLCMKINSGRKKDMGDIEAICDRLLCTYKDVEDRYRFLYGDLSTGKQKLFRFVKNSLKRKLG